MNGARLGIAAQSVGLSQAAYNEALAYAKDRKQFGKAIIEFPAVVEILSLMKAKLDASRSLLYETARFVDVYKALDDIAKERKLTPEERAEQKTFAKLADAFTPLGKGMGSEFANQNAYDCIQIHGGSGFMKDYACERIYRDSRITSIYEGTTQLQVVKRHPLCNDRRLPYPYPGIREYAGSSRTGRLTEPSEKHGKQIRSLCDSNHRGKRSGTARLLCTPPRRNGSSHHHGSPDGTGRFKERSVL